MDSFLILEALGNFFEIKRSFLENCSPDIKLTLEKQDKQDNKNKDNARTR